jgi:hypothetical protein
MRLPFDAPRRNMVAYITTLLAIAGIAISYFQWRTAQTKIALDIFDRRYKIYEDLRNLVTEFSQNLNFSLDIQRAYLDAQSRARFYFGEDVEDYLEKMRIDLIRGHYFDRFEQRQLLNVDEQVARLDRINAFYSEIDKLFVPYMRFGQRMPLWWWPRLVNPSRQWLPRSGGSPPRIFRAATPSRGPLGVGSEASGKDQ